MSNEKTLLRKVGFIKNAMLLAGMAMYVMEIPSEVWQLSNTLKNTLIL